MCKLILILNHIINIIFWPHNKLEMSKKQRQIEYIRLSQKGKQQYLKVSKEAYFTMALWSFTGAFGGYLIYKILPKIPILNQNYYIRKYKYTPLFIVFITLSYHGYKLMQFMKRKGIRQVAKDPANIWSQTPEKQVR